jgi:hypothetical protein
MRMGLSGKDEPRTTKPVGEDTINRRRGSTRLAELDGRIATSAAKLIRLSGRDVPDRNRRPR